MNNTKDIKLSVSEPKIQKLNQVLQNRRRMLGKVGTFEFKGSNRYQGSRNAVFSQPAYDLAEIARASDVEPYVAQSIKKHREKILKEGFQISGEDEDLVNYIKKRLFEISLVSGVSTEEWLRDLVYNLVTFHTAFLVLKRDSTRSTGRPIKVFNKVLNPIAGIFVPDSSTMEVSVDKYGVPILWRQRIESLNYNTAVERRNNEFPVEDVVVITMDKKSGYTFGTPYLLPVLDDIRALRKLEELSIIIASKEAFPLYHYKVGTDERPAMIYDDSSTEVDNAVAQASAMPAQGFIVTSERYSIELVSKGGSGLDLNPYLKYFEARVLAGLRLSELDLGRGGAASKGTASNIDKNLEDAAKDYQKVLTDTLSMKLILHLILEGGYNIDYDKVVKFEFPMIDREELRAKQTHGLSLFQANTITLDEYRKAYLNMKPLSEEELFKTNRSINSAIDSYYQPFLNPQPKAPGEQSSPVVNKVANRIQPENQYGKLPTKKKVTANDQISEFLKIFKDRITFLMDSDEVSEEDISEIKAMYSTFVSDYVASQRDYIQSFIAKGWNKAKENYENKKNINIDNIEKIGNRLLTKFDNNFLIKSFWAIGSPILDNIAKYLQRDQDNNLFFNVISNNIDYLDLKLSKLSSDQVIVAYKYGFALLAKRVGYKQIVSINKKDNSQNIIDISSIQYKKFLPSNLEEEINFLSDSPDLLELPDE